MNHKAFFKTAGVIFLLIALGHLLRIVYGWPVTFGATMIPIWLSWVALIVGVYLGYYGLKFAKR